MKKTLGQIAYEQFFGGPDDYDVQSSDKKARWERMAASVKRAVLRELRREGRLDRQNIVSPPGGAYEYPKKKTKARKK